MSVLKYWDEATRTWKPIQPGPVNTLSKGTATTGAPGSAFDFSITGESPDQVLSMTVPKGDKGEQGFPGQDGGGLLQEVADARYERKLLTQAVAWYDAGVLTDDGTALRDLSDNGRHAVFGAGAAAPLVLPYDGEPYLYLPPRADNAGDTINSSILNVACSDMQVTIHGAFQSRPIDTQIFQVGDSSTGWLLKLLSDGSVVSVRYGAQTVSATLPSGALTKAWNRFTHTTAEGRTVWEQSDDGAAWEVVGSASHGTCVPSTSSHALLGGGWAAHHAAGTRHRVDMHLDGVLVHQMIPSNHHTNYTKIRNTGTAGGDWTIGRAASGFKTAVVDRPLLLFGGGQGASVQDYRPNLHAAGGTALIALREFADTGTNYYLTATYGITGGTRPGWLIYSGASESFYRVKDGTTNRQSVGPRTSGQSVFVGVEYGSQSVLHLNGVAAPPAKAVLLPHQPDSDLRIGGVGASPNDGRFEFIAAAIFDRALTDAEVAQASAELLGTPMHEQADPLPQYILAPSTTVRRHGEWETVATWAALPASGNWPGRRVKVLDGLGLCVAVWDGAKWVVDAQSDTGLMQAPNALTAAWGTVQWNRLRRLGNLCYWQHSIQITRAIIGNNLYDSTLPLGWRPEVLSVNDCVVSDSQATQIAQLLLRYGTVAAHAPSLYKIGTAITEGSFWRWFVTYTTADPWPTTAP